MRVFVLGTGRCGTTTFVRACEHLTNFTAGHETRTRLINADRFRYPDDHLEADNRLTWFLGELGDRFPDARYVHLRRDPDQVTESFLNRWRPTSIIETFGTSIVQRPAGWPVGKRRDVARFYIDTVTTNVEAFLRGRDAMTMWLHEADTAFPKFLNWIDAQGDLTAARAEWRVQHNKSVAVLPPPAVPSARRGLWRPFRP